MEFEEVYNEWKVYISKRHKKQGYETLYRNFTNHIYPFFRDFELCKITKQDILNWQNYILDSNYSNNFNFTLFVTLNSFFKFCLLNNYISENPVLGVENFKKKIEVKKNYVTYNLYEFLKFRFYLDNFVYKQYFTFMFFYGTRPSEAMALRFCDFKKNYIYIRHSLQRKGKRELDTPKNQSSIRIIKISLFMKIRIQLLKKFYKKCFSDFNEGFFIFGGKKPITPTTTDRYKKVACVKANLPVITQHGFRHSYATRNIHNKVPIDKVSKTMGHSKVSTTLDVYLHHNLKFDDSLFQ